jgi:hypothetical protein
VTARALKHGYEFDPEQWPPIMELLCDNTSDVAGIHCLAFSFKPSSWRASLSLWSFVVCVVFLFSRPLARPRWLVGLKFYPTNRPANRYERSDERSFRDNR